MGFRLTAHYALESLLRNFRTADSSRSDNTWNPRHNLLCKVSRWAMRQSTAVNVAFVLLVVGYQVRLMQWCHHWLHFRVVPRRTLTCPTTHLRAQSGLNLPVTYGNTDRSGQSCILWWVPQSSTQEEKLLNFDCNEGEWKRDTERRVEDELALIQCTVNSVIASRKGPNILCRYKQVILTEEYNVMVNVELIGTTEYLTLCKGCRINRCRYNREWPYLLMV